MDCLERLAGELRARRPAALLTVLAAPPGFPLAAGHKLLIGPDGLLAGHVPDPAPAAAPGGAQTAPGTAAALVAAGQAALAAGRPGTRDLHLGGAAVRVYVEPYLPPPELVVVGAGHVAQPVAGMAKLAGFAVTVLDDRPDYASRGRFPGADQVICAPLAAGLQGLHLGPAHHVVLLTRGHRHDLQCLRQLLPLPLAYIGMIGSRTRVQTVFRLLQAEHGVDPAQFRRVYAPIGLDIGARTPAEIAVAVVAELIRVRRGGTGQSLSRLHRALVHGPAPGGRPGGDGPGRRERGGDLPDGRGRSDRPDPGAAGPG